MGYYVRELLFFSQCLIFTYLTHLELSSKCMFALNFDIIYLFEFLILVTIVKGDERKKFITCD